DCDVALPVERKLEVVLAAAAAVLVAIGERLHHVAVDDEGALLHRWIRVREPQQTLDGRAGGERVGVALGVEADALLRGADVAALVLDLIGRTVSRDVVALRGACRGGREQREGERGECCVRRRFGHVSASTVTGSTSGRP